MDPWSLINGILNLNLNIRYNKQFLQKHKPDFKTLLFATYETSSSSAVSPFNRKRIVEICSSMTDNNHVIYTK